MKYLAYDVETANTSRESICAVGWVLVNNDRIVNKGGSLINPKCRFSSRNISVHGIQPEMVENAPTFPQYWSNVLAPMVEKSLVIAYNAAFDVGATKKAMEAAGLPVPDFNYMDIFAVMKKCVTAGSYKLSDLATYSGYTYHSHDPIEDAEAIIHLLKYVSSQAGFDDIAELLIHSRVPVRNTMDDEPALPPPVSHSAPAPRETCFDGINLVPGSVAGLRICLTGEAPGVEREDINNMIAFCGGKPTTSVSGKTDYLVVGVYEDYGPDYVSSKQKKAMEMIEQGANIKIIDYPALACLLSGNARE